MVSGVAGANTVTVQFKPFGVKLEFTGIIEEDNTIRLKVFPEVSSLDFGNAVTINGFVLPAIATRHAETVVELRDGQSFGIAGLLDKRTSFPVFQGAGHRRYSDTGPAVSLQDSQQDQLRAGGDRHSFDRRSGFRTRRNRRSCPRSLSAP